MTSGVTVTSEAVKAFVDVQDKHVNKFVTMKFSDKFDKIELADVGVKGSTFEDLLAAIPKHHIRYIFYDCEYTTISNQSRNKVLFVSWSSDDHAPAKEKMLITSSMKEVVAKCKGYAKHTTINDYDELNEENFISIVSENRSK